MANKLIINQEYNLPQLSETNLSTDQNSIIFTNKNQQIIVEAQYKSPDIQSIDQTNLKYMDPTDLTTYTIPSGTILFHGTKIKDTFNPKNIKLGDNELVAFFSTSKRFAADFISSCGNYPIENGYIHMFRVTKDINNIFIISSYEFNNKMTDEFLQKYFCNGKNIYNSKFNGVGFFIQRVDDQLNPNINYIPEFAICDPNQFLEYINTQRCQAKRSLSDSYRFDG